MSISWIDAMQETAFLSWLRNDYKTYSHYRIVNTDYDEAGMMELVDWNQQGICRFFSGYQLPARFYGLSTPIKQLSQQVLNVMYRMNSDIWHVALNMTIRCIRHILVGLLAFLALPLLMVYQLFYHQIYLGLIHADHVSPEQWASGGAYFLGQVASSFAVLVIEFIRNGLSLLLNLMMLVLNVPMIITKCLATWYGARVNPGNHEAIKAQAESQLSLIMNEISAKLAPLRQEANRDSFLKLVNDYLSSEKSSASGPLAELVEATTPPIVVYDKEADQYALQTHEKSDDHEILRKINEHKDDMTGLFRDPAMKKMAHNFFGDRWGELCDREQALKIIMSTT